MYAPVIAAKTLFGAFSTNFYTEIAFVKRNDFFGAIAMIKTLDFLRRYSYDKNRVA